jgi:hypothetical protein
MKSAPPAMRRGAHYTRHNRIRITAMNGKSSKYASAVLTALLYTQGLLAITAVTLVMVKERIQVDTVLAMNAAPHDAEVR